MVPGPNGATGSARRSRNQRKQFVDLWLAALMPVSEEHAPRPGSQVTATGGELAATITGLNASGLYQELMD